MSLGPKLSTTPMTTDEELRHVADAVESSLSVVGCGPRGAAAVDGFRGDCSLAPGASDAGQSVNRQATVVAVDVGDVGMEGSDADTATRNPTPEAGETLSSVESSCRGDDAFSIVVVGVPSRFGVSERAAIDRLQGIADAVVLVRDGWLPGAISQLVALIEEAGVVNLDLADVQTLLSPDGMGTLSSGTGPESTPETAVSAALEGVISDVDVAAASGAIVDVSGTPDLSVDGAASLVGCVRDRIDGEAHVIWGTAVDEETSGSSQPGGADGSVRVRLLLSGIEPPEPTRSPGDRCPRCDGTLSGYTMGDSTTIACDACGYAGVSRR
ncbi:cell division protein FtsZ [Halalkaliarchaeum desulfuricum]|uniref:Cell division protein FtsZ n=1 Tax=Halalkaliarchaeum desulfuricum TaxID=2055893 RepID=A0A343TI13_9EURY|nr:hypothetical protein [Halalkaliarchaeum desulfuricum]AUX08735.1 cell division protein FtsZ [Halalkaliarchaeum desulfuricum]